MVIIPSKLYGNCLCFGGGLNPVKFWCSFFFVPRVLGSVKTIREKKAYSTLHMEVATAEMANRLITEGLMKDYEIKDCERFTRGCTMT